VSTIKAVLVDGDSVPFSLVKDFVEVEVEAGPGQARDIEIVNHPRPRGNARRMGLIHNSRVLVRRSLSEFRDNALARHPRLLHAATGLARALRLTGHRRG